MVLCVIWLTSIFPFKTKQQRASLDGRGPFGHPSRRPSLPLQDLGCVSHLVVSVEYFFSFSLLLWRRS